MQLREGQQACQEGQPEVERTGVNDEGTAQQRPDVPMCQVVQVGAGALDDDVVCVLAKHQDGATDAKQHRHIPTVNWTRASRERMPPNIDIHYGR